MAEIQFKGITKRYPDGFEAVKAIDLDIADDPTIREGSDAKCSP